MAMKSPAELEKPATTFKAEIEKRLASGPATRMDFVAIKTRIRDEVENRNAKEKSRRDAGGPRG